MKELNPVHIPLNGYVLIEASAGTGKTHALSSLYLRFIMEEGVEVKDILVVTYTKAATEELRLKIKDRLESSLKIIQGRLSPEYDPFIQELLEKMDRKEPKDPKIKLKVEGRLEAALANLDEAAIFTIHGFCQRVLRDFAFESDSPFDAKIIESEDEIQLRACQEFVRTHFYKQAPELLEWIGIAFKLDKLPERLLEYLPVLLELPQPHIKEPLEINDVIKEIDSFRTELKKLLSGHGNHNNMIKLLKSALTITIDHFFSYLDKEDFPQGLSLCLKSAIEYVKNSKNPEASSLKKLPGDHHDILLSLAQLKFLSIEALSSGKVIYNLLETAINSKRSAKTKGLRGWMDLQPESIHAVVTAWRKEWLKDAPIRQQLKELLNDPLYLDLFTILGQYSGLQDRLKAAVLNQARDFILSYSNDYKEKHGLISYNDMLTRLFLALKGPKGGNLAKQIHKRYPVALIDEFQDTDAIQWQIFHTIYPDPDNSRLILIGDPKQAIYGFRGADIFTYLQAKEMVKPGHRFGLTRNWRSIPSIVNAINKVFGNSQENPFLLPGIEYQPIKASKEDKEGLTTHHIPGSPALEIWLDTNEGVDNTAQTDGKTAFVSHHREQNDIEEIFKERAELVALEIKHLFGLSQEDKVYFTNIEGDNTPLTLGDIVILVPDFMKAKLIRDALSKQAIPSVYYGPESVFTTNEARELLYVLNGIINPSDIKAISTALATTILGFDGKKLLEAQQDQNRWEEILDNFWDLRSMWTERGIFPMLFTLISRFDVAKRLLSLKDGERRLTNLRQLMELLAEAEKNSPGLERLFAWFQGNITKPDYRAEDQRLRLESDENLVKVMTYHRSKGLEFPVVFLPYLDQLRIKLNKKLFKFYDHDIKGYVCPIAHRARSRSWVRQELVKIIEDGTGFETTLPTQLEYLEKCQRQYLAELARLIYVALTRAKYKLYLNLGISSPMPLLNRIMFGQLMEKEDMGQYEWGPGTLEEKLATLFKDQDRVSIFTLKERKELIKNTQSEPQDQQETIISIPRITRSPLAPWTWCQTSFSALSNRGEEDIFPLHQGQASEEVEQEEPDIFSFPRGTRPGNCVHKLLETIDFQASREEIRVKAAKLLEEFNIDTSWDTVLAEAIERVLRYQLSPGLQLQGLNPKWISREMEFLWPFDRGLAETALEIKDGPDQGMVRGYIDLIFKHEDRFYILDYKTNWLGNSPADYQGKALIEAMDQHNYWLQAGIYARAVDRFLATIIPGYDFYKHIGGVFYLFIRGMARAERQGQGVVFIPPSELARRFPELLPKHKDG